MRTVEVPREKWAGRLDEFSTIHEGWLVSVDVLGPEIGAQHEVHQLPLIGISVERADHNRTVTLSVARSTNERLTHVMHGVSRIFIEQTDDGADANLEVESGDGTKTIVRLRSAPSGPSNGA